MAVRKLTDLGLRKKRVLVRADLNVPLDGTNIANDLRIRASLPTIQHILKCGGSVILVSHLGRPKPDEDNSALSLQPVANRISELLRQPVMLVASWREGVVIKAGEVALLENIRFETGETTNDPELARKLASLCDVYVNDAFGTAHRTHASTEGIAKHVQVSCAGLLLTEEIDALERALDDPKRPLVAVVGGAKVSGKLEVLHNLKNLADTLLVGGGMANTFLLAAGYEVGESLVETDLLDDANSIGKTVNLPLPVDVMTAKSIDSDAHAFLHLPDSIPKNERIVDIGPATARRFSEIISDAGTVIWNGPMGIFEYTQFADGTRAIAEAIAETSAFTLAGGGDTVAAIEQFGIPSEQLGHISTGGGAFLEFVEGNSLPSIDVLRNNLTPAR